MRRSREVAVLTPERRERVDELFDAALDLRAAERAEWLAAVCGGDPALRAEVEALLAAHERPIGILEADAVGLAANLATNEHGIPAGLERLGPYRLVAEVGRGGMGCVYLAIRDDTHFAQRVAVKVLHRDFTGDSVARFLAERQILASLDHPNIGRLLDGGLTRDRRPYFVMEYVDGEPLDLWCDRRRLSVTERLRLFCKVAAAVQHAHRNLVVHRDLKPSNVLVTGDGRVKLLDFGIAKLLDPGAMPGIALQTETGARLMTPEYASPEQVAGRTVTTAVDVYALGLMLYELLTGVRPQARQDATSFADIERRILYEDPSPPSIAALVPRANDANPAQFRSVSPVQLHRRLRGDLDRIVMTALRKEPERRYASAAQMADDVERFLSGGAILARGDSASYRFRKFVARHRWKVGGIVMVLMLLAGYAVTLAVQRERVKVALAEARLAAERAERVTDFALELFEAGAREDGTERALTVADLLAHGAERAERLAAQPAAQATMLDVVGRVHQRLGQYAVAESVLARALELRREALGSGHPETAEVMQHLAALLSLRGRYAEAESLYRATLDVQRAALGDRHPRVAASLDGLSVVLRDRGDFAGAERAAREALAMRRELLGARHPAVAVAMTNVAYALQLQGRPEEAFPLYRDALARHRALLGDGHLDVASAQSNLGLLLMQRGELARAESLYRVSLGTRRRHLGAGHPDVALSLGLLGALERRRGDLTAAESLYRQSLRITHRALGHRHPDVLHTETGLAHVLRARGRLAEAESLYRHVLEERLQVLGERHPAVASSMSHLGVLLMDRGADAEAEQLLRRALALRRRLLGDDHPLVADAERNVARLAER